MKKIKKTKIIDPRNILQYINVSSIIYTISKINSRDRPNPFWISSNSRESWQMTITTDNCQNHSKCECFVNNELNDKIRNEGFVHKVTFACC